MYLVKGQQVPSQDGVVRIVWFLVGESMKGNGCNILCADEGNLAIAASRVDLALAFDRVDVGTLREVFLATMLV